MRSFQDKGRFKFNNNFNHKLNSFNQSKSLQNKNNQFTNIHLHIPGKINFH
jgi:hypothetical protein